ncbi:MAG: hemerythrin family protein [Spirochaetales bacterium]|nr:hemerythrin family protein [Spirochaetales bacterium]
MKIEWNHSFEIHIPLIDAEHKYLVRLFNDFCGEFENNTLEKKLYRVFTHLEEYIKKHFANEEELMAVIGYPDREKQKKEHKTLLKDLRILSEQYLGESRSITADTMGFLKTWVYDHIIILDTEIGSYLRDHPLSWDWRGKAVFSEEGSTIFKHCTMCGKVWQTYEDFLRDGSKRVIGLTVDESNSMYNIIMANCSCGTTLGFLLSDFIGESEIPFVMEEGNHRGKAPAYCLKEDKNTPCRSKCACRYTSQILSELNYEIH